MAYPVTKIYLNGANVHLEPEGEEFTITAMDCLHYSISGNDVYFSCESRNILIADKTKIQDINGTLLVSEATVINYLDQFIGAQVIVRASNATSSVVVAAMASTLLLAANEHRITAHIYNNSTSTLYIKYGTGAGIGSFTNKQVGAGKLATITDYKGIIHGYWSAAVGDAQVTETHI